MAAAGMLGRRGLGACVSGGWGRHQWRGLAYEQGQLNPSSRRREYFYYVDHNGFLFLDDAKMKNFTSCFKDREFLDFFFKRLQVNETGHHEHEFPFLSPCGREYNYVRCDDTPLVFTRLLPARHPVKQVFDLDAALDATATPEPYVLIYGGQLAVDFEPELLTMTDTGRLYYPTPKELPLAHVTPNTLVASPIAVSLGRYMRFGAERTILHWQGEAVDIDVRLDEDDETTIGNEANARNDSNSGDPAAPETQQKNPT
ncbi:uncharacterized protein MONBRDRAFT_33175 [Monosiga brevicollis MX1]|uniref:Uncharacterized protein n=1 Tax=Monosiga brevicollis TaxID=81824 RepID=A9V3I1_MONBE|nr:uncharacterized protein MONBRDRAFT_33175 [Monosiga brevicollis MX1]EDQ87917.1 predicted protein [Monosiga brevicollis MX1]|eukprot:XP_001747450.1 hypothetical protein [Monosiga brevicollis MX1]